MRNPSRPRLDLQGHRGARGHLPENTVASFELAAAQGMHAVELDLVLSGDDVVVVSHEPWCKHLYCLAPDGARISEDDELAHNIHAMTFAQLQTYDCGSLGHPHFPTQRARPSRKPDLATVVSALDAYTDRAGRSAIRFNVEVKSRPDWVGRFQPEPERLAERVYREVETLGILERSTLQSFDPAVVCRFRQLDPVVEVAFLVENRDPFETNLDRLDFVPDIYAPWFPYIDAALVETVHDAGLLLITWTVNETDDMERLAGIGVDGLITDFPDRAAACFSDSVV